MAIFSSKLPAAKPPTDTYWLCIALTKLTKSVGRLIIAKWGTWVSVFRAVPITRTLIDMEIPSLSQHRTSHHATLPALFSLWCAYVVTAQRLSLSVSWHFVSAFYFWPELDPVHLLPCLSRRQKNELICDYLFLDANGLKARLPGTKKMKRSW